MAFYSKKLAFLLILLLNLTGACACLANEENISIGAVIVEGSTAFNKQQLLNRYFDFLGLKASKENIDGVRNRLVTYYSENDYFLPDVKISPHPEILSVFTASIYEPVLTSFAISGGSSHIQTKANAYLNALIGSTVHSDSQFEYLEDTMQKRLQASVEIKATRAKGTTRDFHLDIELSGAINSKVSISNEGSDRLGKEILSAEVRLSDTVPGFHEFYFNTYNTISTDGFRSLGSGFIISLGANNFLVADTNISKARLEESGQADILFDKQNLSLGWQTLSNSTVESGLGLSAKILARDFQQEQVIIDIDEKLRILELGYWQYQLYDNHSVDWSLYLRQGVDGMGAELTGPLADSNTDLDFSTVNLNFVFRYLLPKQWSLRIDTLAQYSGDNLPFSQRFAIASNATARAYESGELNGDSGAGIKFELRKGFEASFLSEQWVPYFYYGTGRVKDNLLEESVSGASVGLGIRWFEPAYSGYFEVGKPLIEESIYRTSTPRAQASFSYHF